VPNPARKRESVGLKARYVFPVTSEPIASGVVTMHGDRITAVGKEAAAGETHDLGNVAVVPGLVNAHTHLDLSDLAKPLGEPGMGLTDWLRSVVTFRQEAAGRRRQAAQGTLQAVEDGLRESIRLGTTTLGEIAQPDWPLHAFQTAPITTTVFLELIAPDAEHAGGAMDLAREHLRLARTSESWRPGLGPHAPYSAGAELLVAVARLSAAEQVPVALHLAESREEIELLRSGGGPFRDFLTRLGAWNPGAFSPGRRPLDYLQMLAPAHRTLVVHGNYLDDEEIAFLGRNSRRMAVVYCPRTHAYFEHPEYPLPKLLEAGATVALGTDSRASSPDLSLLAEMRLVARRFPSIPASRVLRLGTIEGARALGLEHQIGSLEAGKWADLAAVALPDRDAADPHELLFDSDCPVVATWHRGRRSEIEER
jgi:cytosine/adenosine deaminase-related metal-dependent hydrolase